MTRLEVIGRREELLDAQGHFKFDLNAWNLAAIAVALDDLLGLHIITGNMSYSRARYLLMLNLTEVNQCDEIRVWGAVS